MVFPIQPSVARTASSWALQVVALAEQRQVADARRGL